MENEQEYEQLTRLRAEVENIHVSSKQVGALSELLYTATETGFIELSYDHGQLERIIALVQISRKYAAAGVPKELRM